VTNSEAEAADQEEEAEEEEIRALIGNSCSESRMHFILFHPCKQQLFFDAHRFLLAASGMRMLGLAGPVLTELWGWNGNGCT